ncbi:MAG: pyridoxine/pyridoxamine 5'-phosphate oxidase [Candidatus Tectimicrobiota bacterium]|nr:MAG: pyridoxine/pyridoxamine 5'-phosphate oxidase [Candidatus Tectomicrobia bacterium]
MGEAAPEPLAEIAAAWEEARRRGDAYADVCFLATVTAEGRPAMRALVLRDIDAQGVALLLNATSPKWQQLSARGEAALLLLWRSVQRQYRIFGPVVPMPPARLQAYWARKGYASKLLEHYYGAFRGQSQPLPSRDALLQGIAALQQRYPDPEAVPLPETLRGVYLVPTEVELWHGSPADLLHERRLCLRTPQGWRCQLLVP